MLNSSKKFRFASVVFSCTVLGGCLTTAEAPVDSRPTDSAYRAATVSGYSYAPEPVTRGFHQVVAGDTLYSISWRYGLDYRDIATWNNISGNYVIYPGQKLSLVPPAGAAVVRPLKEEPLAKAYPLEDPAATPRTNPGQLVIEDVKQKPASAATPAPGPVASVPVKPEPVRSQPLPNQTGISWRWPTTGEVIHSNTPVAQKGLDITGREGQQIQAAANGVVVYSGSGLLGYGKLIIIKHNETYLSAYAHNQMIQVKEGDTVSGGQVIGTMGKGTKGQPLLHFEIRKDGKPVDPLQYLPARS
jgi:lipoprotein NlpD